MAKIAEMIAGSSPGLHIDKLQAFHRLTNTYIETLNIRQAEKASQTVPTIEGRRFS